MSLTVAMFPQGVTYCGESSASSLTMANVPWHEEVVHFVYELVDLIPDYEIACEHEHSNCLLIAHKKVRVSQISIVLPPLSSRFFFFHLVSAHFIMKKRISAYLLAFLKQTLRKP